MSEMIKIAVDAMGGDGSPKKIIDAIVSEIHFWNDLDFNERKKRLSIFLTNFKDLNYLIEYFDNFREKLLKYNLNSYLKSVSNH